MKLINPEKQKRTKFEKTVAVGGVVDAFISLGLVYTAVQAGTQLYRRAFQLLGDSAELHLTDATLVFTNKEQQRSFVFSEVERVEVFYYDGERQGIEMKYDFPTLMFHIADEVLTVQTLASKTEGRTFLKKLYDTGISIREYMNDTRSYLLRKPLYKEVQELKAKYGPDFW